MVTRPRAGSEMSAVTFLVSINLAHSGITIDVTKELSSDILKKHRLSQNVDYNITVCKQD